MRALLKEGVPKLSTDSCLVAIARLIARIGKTSTIMGDKRTNFDRAEQDIGKYVVAWNKEGPKNIKFSKESYKVQPNGSTSFWRSIRSVDQKLQEAKVCGVGEQIKNRGRSLAFDL